MMVRALLTYFTVSYLRYSFAVPISMVTFSILFISSEARTYSQCLNGPEVATELSAWEDEDIDQARARREKMKL